MKTFVVLPVEQWDSAEDATSDSSFYPNFIDPQSIVRISPEGKDAVNSMVSLQNGDSFVVKGTPVEVITIIADQWNEDSFDGKNLVWRQIVGMCGPLEQSDFKMDDL